mmetsp:Transcript_15827/g.27424  ORF Transcript_15827/g.27424 Transcript_15827/m.27424 type:complete len:119 (+) Transcript_15827:7-363(+)
MQQMQQMQHMQPQQGAMYQPPMNSVPQMTSGPGPSFGAPSPAAAPAGRQAGNLKKWFEEKGFGFIKCDDAASGDIFVHFSQVRNGSKEDLNEGMRLSFDVAPDERSGRVKATNVMIER